MMPKSKPPVFLLSLLVCLIASPKTISAEGLPEAKPKKQISYANDLLALRPDESIRHLCAPLNEALRKSDFKLAANIMRCIALSFRFDENDRAACQAALMATRLDPNNALAEFQAAEYLNRNGEQTLSESILEKIAEGKDERLALRASAFLAHQKGYTGKAMELMQRYLEKYPDDQRTLLRLCYIYQNIDDRDDAAISYKRLAELSDTEYLRQIYLGRAAEVENKLNDAIKAYQKAGNFLPYDPLWHSQLAAIFLKQQKLKEADYQLKQCFECSRLLSSAYSNWAVKESFFGSSKQAHQAIAYIQELRPNASEIWLVNGIILERENRSKEAVESFRKSLSLNCHNSSVYQHLLQAAEFSASTKRKELCKQWVDACPSSGLAAIELANAIARENDPAATRKAYEKARDLVRNRRPPSDPNYRIAICKMRAQLSVIYYKNKEKESALEEAKAFNSLRPESAANMGMRPPKIDLSKIKDKELKAAEHALLADVLSETRDLNDAEKEYREAIKQDPNDSMYHSCLLKVLLDKKDFAAAAAEDAKVSHQIVSHVGDIFSKKK